MFVFLMMCLERVISLHLYSIPARNHGYQVIPDPRGQYHEHMDKKESRKKKAADEMIGARGLPSSKYDG